jgi:MarR family transcriptional regulator for hemolysin
MESIEEVIFYVLEKGIKTYRQFAQKNITLAGLEITIDQWLVMKVIITNPKLKQQEIAKKVFKDSASVTRIINLLIKKGLIERNTHSSDRRRTELKVTKNGIDILKKVQKIVNSNRLHALNGVSEREINDLSRTIQTIVSNCKN